MTDYTGLFRRLEERGLSRTAFAKQLGISSRTMAKIGRGEQVSHRVVGRMAAFLECEPEDLCRTVSDNTLLQALRDERRARISGGIYHELQVRMTYNSNHIEGSRLTEDQTRMIFETRTIDAEGGVPVDDVLETVNHFRAVDLCIDRAEEPLTEDLVKGLHRILKQGTRDSSLDWFAVGDYKRRPNVVGGRTTCAPADVAREMGRLVSGYAAKDAVSFTDIVGFHHDFERIHPFRDGNGRVGRLVAFKECLRHGHVPFLIEDSKKAFYYRGLAQWESEPGYLVDTCRDGQDIVAALMASLGIGA
ncbi:Fic family protein [Atopobiaceae bacterium 24-176]